MDTGDWFGGVSSDEEEEKEEAEPTPQPTPMTSNTTMMMDFELSDDDETKPLTLTKEPEPIAPVKFFLPSDEDDEDQMTKRAVKREMTSEDVTSSEAPPPAKKPRAEAEEPKVAAPPPQESTQKELIARYGPSSSSETNTPVEDEIYDMKKRVLLANMSKEQFDRYEAFRKSSFQKSTIRSLLKKYTNQATIGESVVTAVAGLAKVLVGDIVEQALDLREAVEGEKETPLEPNYIRQAYLTLEQQNKL